MIDATKKKAPFMSINKNTMIYFHACFFSFSHNVKLKKLYLFSIYPISAAHDVKCIFNSVSRSY